MSHFMQNESSSRDSQETVNCPHPEPYQPSRRLNQGGREWLGTWHIRCRREMPAGFLLGKRKDTDPMADLGVHRRIILKWILNTLNGKAYTDMRQDSENWRAFASIINIIYYVYNNTNKMHTSILQILLYTVTSDMFRSTVWPSSRR